MLDLTRKHFGYSQLWPARCQNQAESYKPDPPSCIWFGFILPQKAWTIQCKTNTDPIWMAWPSFGPMHMAQKQESSDLVSGRMQPARYQFPTFRFSCILPQMAQIILCKISPDPICFCLTGSGSGQTDLAQMQATLKESSGLVLASASDVTQIQHVYWVTPALILGAVSVTTSSQPDCIKHCHT